MKAEVLYIADCPNLAAARSQTERLLKEHGVFGSVHEVEVPDRATAKRLAFEGSPTIRIDGEDVAISPGGAVPAFACRTYAVEGRLSGIPADDLVRAAIRRALDEPAK